jgi:CRISPR system Cascade subunit CasA
LLPLHLKSSRIGYRQYIGLVLDNNDDLKLPADVVHAYRARAKNLIGEEQNALPQTRLLVAGYAMDNMKPLDFAEALVPLVVTGTDTGDRNVADMGRRLVASADRVAIALVAAVKLALYGPKSEVKGDSTVLEPVRQRFWADTEQDFYEALRQAATALVPDGTPVKRPGDVKAAAGEIWRRTLRRHALKIFDDTVPIEDAAADDIKNVVDGRRNLGLMLDGYSPAGKKLFAELQLPAPANKPK